MPIKQSSALGVNDHELRYNGNDKRLHGGNKDNNNVVDDNNSMIMIRQNDEFTSALSILSIKQSHAGEYTCRVQNDASVVQYSAVLKVNGIITKKKAFFITYRYIVSWCDVPSWRFF